MKILVDTNVLMDFLTERTPFCEAADQVIKLCAEGKVTGYMAAHSISNLFYLLRKTHTVDERRDILLNMSTMLEIEGITRENVHDALRNTDFYDFEDCLQMECGRNKNIDFIVTRNTKDFIHSEIKAITPPEFLERVNDNMYSK